MAVSIEQARRWYAEELRFTTNLQSQAVTAAFGTVPRERFVGPGPWRIISPMRRRPMRAPEYWTTDDADPRHVYHDVLIALDESRILNNGQPSLYAYLFDQLDIRSGEQVLHLGCGTGYYSAILAELVGPQGSVTAVELDENISERARIALQPWSHAVVVAGDGTRYSSGPVDLIVASAGATHPLPLWLDALKPSGRLLIPLTAGRRAGAILLVQRSDDGFAARFLLPVNFIEFAGARDPDATRRLTVALERGDMFSVRSLRRAPEEPDNTCWLAGNGWWLSTAGIDGNRSS
jgi:protein-L-isoaspartate(D-aspartate) O-methyltransferase